MKKRAWPKFAVALMLSFAVLAGCAQSQTPEAAPAEGGSNASEGGGSAEKIELRFVSWDTAQASVDIMNNAKAAFEKENPNITIKIETSPYENYMTKLQTEIAAGSAPDMIQIGERDFRKYLEKGIVIDLMPYAEGEIKYDLADINPTILEVIKVDGKLPVLNIGVATTGIFYNKKLFDAAGIPYPKEDWTWEEFVEIAKRLTVEENGKIVQYGANLNLSKDWVETLVQSNGGKYLSDDGKTTKGALDSPETVEALQFIVDLYNVHKVAPNPADLMALKGIDLFGTGMVAMNMNGSWATADLRANPELDFGVAGLPRFADGKRANLMYTSGYGISSDSKHPEEAWKFLQFLTSPETDSGKALAGFNLTASKKLAEATNQASDPYYGVFLKELDHIANSAYFINPYWGATGDKVLNPAIEAMVLNNENVQQALSNVTNALDKELADQAAQ